MNEVTNLITYFKFCKTLDNGQPSAHDLSEYKLTELLQIWLFIFAKMLTGATPPPSSNGECNLNFKNKVTNLMVYFFCNIDVTQRREYKNRVTDLAIYFCKQSLTMLPRLTVSILKTELPIWLKFIF